MTGGRCPRRKKMMGRCPDGGCGTDERPCRLNTRVPATQPENSLKQKQTAPINNVDFFSQARKALSERSPFDVPEDGSGSSSVTTLPGGLANLLKQSDSSRKKHKRSHSTSDKKKSSSNRSKGGNIWVETEDYFRDVALPDIDALYELSSSLKCLGTSQCFSIPNVGNEKNDSNLTLNCDSGNAQETADTSLVMKNGNEHGTEVQVKNEVKQEEEQFMEIDSVGAQSDRAKCVPEDSADCLVHEEGKVSANSTSSSCLEWLLGCRSRTVLTSERPSKRRKLLGTDAGLEKVLVGSPCEGNTSLCDFCCKSEISDESNPLVVCSSCKVAVHLNCYGVQGDIDEYWLCSWCKFRTDGDYSVKQPCVLCPKQAGALKPIRPENGDSVTEFVHLFCSLWMPEVFVEVLTKMENIMGVNLIPETRWKSVCSVCKVKHGVCVRCSNGNCRLAFHPICAREAKHRIEVWGKHGSEDRQEVFNSVELRAFCFKHSELPEGRTNLQLGNKAVSSDSTNKQHNLRIGRNGDKVAVLIETPNIISDISGDSASREIVLSDSRSNDVLISESADGDQVSNIDMSERSDGEAVNLPDSLNVTLILKKLIDRGKVNLKDLELDIGISPESLRSTLDEDSLVPEMQCKLVKWLRNHAYLGTSHKNMKVQKVTVLSKTEMEANDLSDGITLSESDMTDHVVVRSVPPRRRTKNNVRILRDNKIICSSEEYSSDGGMLLDEFKVDQRVHEEPENSTETSIEPNGIHDALAAHLPKSEGSSDCPSGCTRSEKAELEHTAGILYGDSDMSIVLPDLEKIKENSSLYVHPYIHKKLLQMQSGLFLEDTFYGSEDLRVGETCCLEASSNTGVCCDHQTSHPQCNDLCRFDEVNPEQFVKAKKLGVQEMSPVDEVEGEIIYFQHRLLSNAISRKRFTDNLICKVVKSLPHEIDITRSQKWDAVLVNQYLNDIREAKKQGRKERKHKEAQAVLAAATAAAAASSRISSFRKDVYDESSYQEKFNISNGRAGISSQLLSRTKETLSRVAIPRNSSEKYSEFVQSVSDFSKEHPRSCDVCRGSDTILNPILVCSSCKVAVHLDCYRSVRESTGPWYCELCDELLSSKSSSAGSLDFWEKNYFECGLCGGTTGAFRKSSDNQWVHAFCAEVDILILWVFEPTFRRGQVNPVEGMDTVGKGIDHCCICRRKHGVCIKCSYGHCHTTFHPSCARSAGFYMNVKSLNGKLQHKAYCERHGLEQKTKAETQKHGADELRSMKQIRVELERLRLLCERIIKREKIKRDLVLCSHSILSCKRDHVARSVLAHNPFFHPDISSESATTSLKGNIEGYRSCSDAMQRSDDVTVDSNISVLHRVKVTMDTDQKTDDSSTSQSLFNRKPMERTTFAGKQIPHRASLALRNPLDDGEWSSITRKHFETFEKELVMTSDQASMKNQKLPKGYFYIPVDCLPKEKQMSQDLCSGEPLEEQR
ncbi:uncharacterized protein LOC126665739 isoform X2 [Mercurialis annua]|uniref:uncharacterized protein LOC126665739 isoform X2 n=1 Tax=Mercurialis annua TaxID=3986 RepID=UPI0024AED485|nr:uncharacterized protein LOC126665739 isoform X2 [Mercurialis annua]